ncbi:MAG TPA: pyroglutamyl-peptidase I [Gammaproteobacteria bacterium]|nr:pyroglutamyl-peptidase I [Gammaproteobacteria bacterium]
MDWSFNTDPVMRKLLPLCLLALTALLCAAAAAAPAQPAYILVTGFEPFGGDKTNGSWEAVQHLQGKRFGNETVVVAELPVVWGKAGEQLHALIVKYHPRAVIAFGQAGAEPVRLETIARNERKPYKDNAGALPPTDAVAASAPATIPTALDVDAVRKSLLTAKIPVVESKDAGGYLCNETFYVLMNDPDAQKIPRGFVHVPPLDATVTAADGSKTLFDGNTLAAAADAVVSSVAVSLPAQ